MFKLFYSLRNLALVSVAVSLFSCQGQRDSLADYVDPFIGTDAHGHTYPGATTPFGLVQLSPDTGTEGWDWCSGYHSSDNSIMGFSHSHLSGTGGADLGDLLFMPSVGEVQFSAGSKENPESGYRSGFKHSSERASAGYYKVFLDEPRVSVELTATPRVGVHRYRFDDPQGQYVMIDLQHGIQDKAHQGYIRMVGDSAVMGYRRSKGWADDHTVFFYATFDSKLSSMDLSLDGKVHQGVEDGLAQNLVAALFFDTPQSEVNIQVGISYVDIDGAKKNLEAQSQGKNFDQILAQTREQWNSALSRVDVTGSEDDKVIFYTALYHSMLAPYGMSDVDGRYIGSDRKIHLDTVNVNYGLFSLWDTFRALHPLMTIVAPDQNQDFIHSMLNYYQQRGELPVWDLNMRENYCMIGYHSIPVIVDAYMKGQRDFDADLALQAMVHSAMQEDYAGVQHYREFSYLPSNKEVNAVSKALEYSYDDWCIAQMAKALGNDSIYQVFNLRAQYYKNHFDPSDTFMKGRNSYGELRSPFDPTEISALGKGDFTEGNSWQYTFFVPQDVSGLIDLMGGDQKFVDKVEALFSAKIGVNNQGDVTGLIGNYAQGNEPGHHIPYLYNYAGQPWQTQQRIAQIKDLFFTSSRDGLCGNEDCGQMSAWYVFSSMGFYPVTPGSPIYALGSPTFQSVEIDLADGKHFRLDAPNASKDNIYIQSAEWNGEPYTKSYITHQMIEGGGTLTLHMGSVPNKSFGVSVEDRPLSAITDNALTSDELLSKIVFEPYVKSPQRVFTTSMVVQAAQHNNETILYTVNGTEPTAYSAKIPSSIEIYDDTVLKIRSVAQDGTLGTTSTFKFFKGKLGDGVTVTGTAPDEPYNKGGLEALHDGLTGGAVYSDPAWVGFVGKDIELEIDLDEPRWMQGVGFGAFNSPGDWIIAPFDAKADYYLDGKLVKSETLDIPEANQLSNGDHYFKIKAFAKADKVKLTLKGGALPKWHDSKGNGAWFFIDEVTIF